MVLATLLPAHLHAADRNDPLSRISGPVEARIVRVIDGDTLVADAMPWPNVVIRTRVRLPDIQAPERGHRAKCEAEAARGESASQYLENIAGPGRRVLLLQIRPGKYPERVVAVVTTADGADVSAILLERGHARTWRSGQPKPEFCSP
jgi:endonuclease YncB( thermonuclease family)